MKPYVTASATASAVALGSYFALAVAEFGLQLRRPTARGTRSDRGTWAAIGITYALAIVLASRARDIAPALSITGGEAWPFYAGLTLFWAGVLLRWWAIVALGRFFVVTVVIQEGHEVVERGPYRYVRHPSYSGALLLVLGLGLVFDNWLALGACALLPPLGFLARIRAEEAALLRELGEPYERYAAATARLIPGVW